MTTTKFRGLRAKANKVIKEIQKKRDEVFKLQSELEDIVDSCEEAVTEFDSGIRNIRDGLDSLSQYL
jgi:hypothetical protein